MKESDTLYELGLYLKRVVNGGVQGMKGKVVFLGYLSLLGEQALSSMV